MVKTEIKAAITPATQVNFYIYCVSNPQFRQETMAKLGMWIAELV